MNIVLIHGQNHKGSSYNIGRMVADRINGENEITEFFLPRDLNHFCIGCYNCIEDETKCPYFEEKQRIMSAVEAADILIFTTPTYCMRASAPMKSFLDLTFTYWMVHRPRECMFEKRAVVISTAAGAGTAGAIKDITTALGYWGISDITKLGTGVAAMGWDKVAENKKEKISKKVTKIAKKLSTTKKPKTSIKTKFLFSMMRMMQKGGMGSSEAEKEYWENKGWFGNKRPWRR